MNNTLRDVESHTEVAAEDAGRMTKPCSQSTTGSGHHPECPLGHTADLRDKLAVAFVRRQVDSGMKDQVWLVRMLMARNKYHRSGLAPIGRVAGDPDPLEWAENMVQSVFYLEGGDDAAEELVGHGDSFGTSESSILGDSDETKFDSLVKTHFEEVPEI